MAQVVARVAEGEATATVGNVPAVFVVAVSDDCPSGLATTVRMAPGCCVHALYADHCGGVIMGRIPACGAGMSSPRRRIVLTDAGVTCPHCLHGDTLAPLDSIS